VTLLPKRKKPTVVTATAPVVKDTFTEVKAAATPVVLTTPASPAVGDKFVVKYTSGDDVQVKTPPTGTPPVSAVVYKFSDADLNQSSEFKFDGVNWVKA
jgi:hypothetical protein